MKSVKVVRGCYTQVHMLISDSKMNCRIVHVNFRRLTAEAALLRPVHVVRIYFAAGGATTLLVPTMAPRALVPLHMSVYTQFI